MKFNQLRDVVAIAERGSLRAAARHLDLAQPALTRSVHELERELGVPLFERRARGMILTPMGEAFVRRANAVLERSAARPGRRSEQLHGGTHGRVVAGLSLAAHASRCCPRRSSRFLSKRYPHVQLHLIEALYPTLEAGLKDGSVDFYVGPEHERAPSSELVQEHLFDNTRIVLGRRGSSAGRRALAEGVDRRRMGDHIGDLQSRGGTARPVRTAWASPAPRLALQSQSALTLMVALATSDLLTMVPVAMDRVHGDQPVTRSHSGRGGVFPRPRSSWSVARGSPPTPAAGLLFDLLRRNVPEARQTAPIENVRVQGGLGTGAQPTLVITFTETAAHLASAGCCMR